MEYILIFISAIFGVVTIPGHLSVPGRFQES